MRTLSIAAVLLAAATAHADPVVTTLAPTCADVAPEGLDEDVRTRTQQVLARTLEQANVLVVDRDCTETYRVAYRDGMIELSGPHTMVREARSPNVGTQLASLVERERAYREPVAAPEAPPEEAPPAEAPPAEQHAEHPEVATAEAPETGDDAEPQEPAPDAPPPVKMLAYAHWGLGGTAGVDGGQAFGIGIRPTLARADLDLSLGMVSSQTYLKVELLSTPTANRAAGYVGGGLSFSNVRGDSMNASNAGLGAELSAGFAVTESHRWFVQADASLPFFTLDTTYPFTFAISLGYAFAKQ